MSQLTLRSARCSIASKRRSHAGIVSYTSSNARADISQLNNGHVQRAWPLIGSLTRTIDYLKLTTEPSASPFGSLMNPLRLLPPSNDWTELEERRRVFWVIFLLDRFCSISTGWNSIPMR
ncbi:MAG: fungal specific transcription factor domain-containing protein [Rhizobiaceae bacterium]|nr:MAG: fungal specific transcription factor domain-containing protein [Rhizobiaceae bacterium]